MVYIIAILIIGLIIYFVIKGKADHRKWQNENQAKILKNIMAGNSCSNCGNHTSACDSLGMPNPCGLWEENRYGKH